MSTIKARKTIKKTALASRHYALTSKDTLELRELNHFADIFYVKFISDIIICNELSDKCLHSLHAWLAIKSTIEKKKIYTCPPTIRRKERVT